MFVIILRIRNKGWEENGKRVLSDCYMKLHKKYSVFSIYGAWGTCKRLIPLGISISGSRLLHKRKGVTSLIPIGLA